MKTMMQTSDSPLNMRTVHWSEALEEWGKSVKGFPKFLLASDFDGTLSPLERRPPDAALHPAVSDWLGRIGNEEPRVMLAVLSGRELADLSLRLGAVVPDAILAGNHGLEIQGRGMDWIHPGVFALRSVLEDLCHGLDQELGGVPGLEIEDKKLSLTLHYRRLDAQLVPALRQRIETFPLPNGIRIHEGKMVFEFRPALTWNKGRAIRSILNHFQIRDAATIYFGDDITDEDVFDELDESSFTIHVGEAENDTRARFFATDPADVGRCLEAIHELFMGRGAFD